VSRAVYAFPPFLLVLDTHNRPRQNPHFQALTTICCLSFLVHLYYIPRFNSNINMNHNNLSIHPYLSNIFAYINVHHTIFTNVFKYNNCIQNILLQTCLKYFVGSFPTKVLACLSSLAGLSSFSLTIAYKPAFSSFYTRSTLPAAPPYISKLLPFFFFAYPISLV
jgi:hypothetical protein